MRHSGPGVFAWLEDGESIDSSSEERVNEVSIV